MRTLQKVFSEIVLPQLPFCIKGANACPMEDCGGVWGYANIIEVMDNINLPDLKIIESMKNYLLTKAKLFLSYDSNEKFCRK